MQRYFYLLICCLGLLVQACQPSAQEKQSPDRQVSTNKEVLKAEEAKTEKKVILFFGNSLTAAYGLNPEEGFTALIQNRLDSLGLPYTVVNAGLSGETTAGGNSRVDWILDQQALDIFVLELGGNDALRGTPTEESFKNLNSIIDKVQAKRPDAKIILAGMEAPPNMGAAYTASFRKMYSQLSKEKQLSLIPFLLDGVGGIRDLNQPDGIHPTAIGHRILAENVWQILAPLL